MGKGHFSLDQVGQSHIQPGLERFWDGAPAASPGHLFQCLTTRRVKHFLLTSNLNLSSFNVKVLPFALSQPVLVISLSPPFLQAPSYILKRAEKVPRGLVEHHEVHTRPLLKPVQVFPFPQTNPLHPLLAVIHKPAKAALATTACSNNKSIEQFQFQ